nr:MAG TPA: hypothetical protein [Caudoviricetes sp.]DAY39552.1 MAG TPA: hypothetical protein [Caudoviricetes sp.]
MILRIFIALFHISFHCNFSYTLRSHSLFC